MIEITYINLDQRADRDNQFKSQFRDISGINLLRFSAIKHIPGNIGCTLSHIACVEKAKEKNLDYLIICEDDFELLVPPTEFVNYITNALHQDWDVFLLTGYLKAPHCSIQNNMARISNAQTTTGYIVKSHYYDTLLENFKEGLSYLIKSPHELNMRETYSIDMYWKRLQIKDSWYISAPLLGKQRIGFSDIDNGDINYDCYFIYSEYNKTLIKNN